MSLSSLLDRWSGTELEDEDGEPLTCELESPATMGQVRGAEARLGFELCGELLSFYSVTNGLTFYGHELSPVDSLSACPNGRPWAKLGHWGNGDYDFVVCEGDAQSTPGAVVFYAHEQSRYFQVAESLEQWLEAMFEETRRSGAVLHPFDYLHRPETEGLYRHVFLALR